MPLGAQELAELIDGHAAALRLWIRSRTVACDDVVQEAFCKLAVEHPAPDNPVAWLYRVCRNLASHARLADERRRHRERSHAVPESVPQSADPLELAETVAAIEQLDAELREVLIARIWGQLALDEVAKICGISTATTHRRYHAALTALRTILEPDCKNKL